MDKEMIQKGKGQTVSQARKRGKQRPSAARRRKASVVTSKSEQMGHAVVGALVGGVVAGPVGAVAGAAVGATVEKGPVRRAKGKRRRRS